MAAGAIEAGCYVRVHARHLLHSSMLTLGRPDQSSKCLEAQVIPTVYPRVFSEA